MQQPQKIKKNLIKKLAYASSKIEGYPQKIAKIIRLKATKLINGHK